MFKSIDKWLPGYLRSLAARPGPVSGTQHLIVCLCDHYEPFRETRDPLTARQIVRDWTAAYPHAVDSFRDADGFSPRHSFFYPQEDYDPAILDDLAAFCRRGHGEVEIHLHHRHDTPDGLREKLVTFRDLLHNQHGLLGKTTDPSVGGNSVLQKAAKVTKEEKGLGAAAGGIINSSSLSSSPLLPSVKNSSPVRYAFIHGNWSLCNSRPDGDWCGVNEELGILSDTGCYADFTFPSAPSPTQPRMVNALYYAVDAPGRPRGADRGVRVGTIDNRPLTLDSNPGGAPVRSKVNGQWSMVSSRPPGELMLITGPLALNWHRRKWGILPRLENAEISGGNPPTPDRIRLWVEQGIHVKGRPDWIFIKLHTHGCVPGNTRVLMGEAMRQAHEILTREFNDGTHRQLHYVTAREMYNLVKAAEAGLPGAPGQYRDLLIAHP